MGSLLNARLTWPRYGMAWSKAEDKKLLKLHRDLLRCVVNAYGKMLMYEAIGERLGRKPCSVMTRLGILRVCRCRK